MKDQITLTSDQIRQLSNFVSLKNVAFLDVKEELVDHLASAIEEDMSLNASLSFEAALDIAYSRFQKNEFHSFIKSKEASLRKYWLKKLGKSLLCYLTFPGILIFPVIYFIIPFWMNLSGNTHTLLIILLTIAPMFNIHKGISGASLHSVYLFASVLTMLMLYFIVAIAIICLMLGVVFNSSWPTFATYLFYGLWFFYYHISIFVVPKLIVEELENKYSHLKPKAKLS